MSKKILITGSSGQLGNELRDIASNYPQFDFLFFNHHQLSINDEAAVKKVFEQHHPAFLINCGAYTAVDKAESEKDLAKEINGIAVGILADHAAKNNSRLIHISTDYVFNGSGNQPLKETDPVDPVNYYGQSKLLGEQLALEKNPNSIIIRSSWIYSSHGHNFLKTMMRLMKEKETVRVVNDQYGSPTNAADLAEAIMQIILSDKWKPGIFNYSNEGVATWFDFANAIKVKLGSTCQVIPIPTTEFPTPAKRPSWSVLDKSKIKSTYGVEIKNWEQRLEVCIDKLR